MLDYLLPQLWLNNSHKTTPLGAADRRAGILDPWNKVVQVP